jgi:hypothetical protein
LKPSSCACTARENTKNRPSRPAFATILGHHTNLHIILPVLKNAVKRIPEGYVYIGKALIGQEYCGNRYAIPGLACVLFAGWVDRTCTIPITRYKKIRTGNDQGHAGPKLKRVPPEKSRTQDAFVEIESLSKGDRRAGQSARRYMIISSFLY